MKVLVLLTFVMVLRPQTHALGIDTLVGVKNTSSDVLKLGAKAGKGIITKVPDLIPTPENLYMVSKQTLIGLPFELLISGIDKLCSIALSANNSTESAKTPKIQEMNYVFFAPNENVSIPLTDSVELWKHPQFDPKKKVVIMVTGWTTDIEEENTAASVLGDAYVKRGDTNFVLVDTARYVDTLYTWSAFNTQELGKNLGRGIAELVKVVPIENIHLMGHSLGSHIAGQAGRTFEDETGKLLPRITGFDPAKPCFREGESLAGLGRGDAEFVDVIHSDAGGLGKSEPIGDVDFFPNGIVPLMPGCLTIFCSHSRAWEYYAETVIPGNENNFPAKKCGSLSSYELNACVKQEIPMGFACPKTAKGNFFLKTNSAKPFGKKK